MATQSSTSVTYDNLFSTTFAAVLPDIMEQIYEANPTVAKLNEAGNIVTQDGGVEIEQTIQTDENTTFGSYSNGGTFDTSDQELFSTALYQWRHVGGTIRSTREEERKNSGDSQKHNLISEKIAVGATQMGETLNKQVLHSGAKVSASDVDGIPLAVPISPSTSGAYAGFDGSTDAFWNNQSAELTTDTFAGLKAALLNLSVNCQLGGSGAPDFYICDPVTWQIMANDMQSLVRIGDKLSANVGFDAIEYRGAMFFMDNMTPDENASTNFPTARTNGSIYALNSKALKLVVDSQTNPAEMEWVTTPTQPTVRTKAMLWTGNLVTVERRALGVLYGIDPTITA